MKLSEKGTNERREGQERKGIQEQRSKKGPWSSMQGRPIGRSIRWVVASRSSSSSSGNSNSPAAQHNLSDSMGKKRKNKKKISMYMYCKERQFSWKFRGLGKTKRKGVAVIWSICRSAVSLVLVFEESKAVTLDPN